MQSRTILASTIETTDQINSSASTLLWWILQIELSVGTIILNFECVVPSKNRDAMLLEATINTIQYSFNSKSDINFFIFNRYNGPTKKNRYNFDSGPSSWTLKNTSLKC